MKQSLQQTLAILGTVALSSCYTWQPPQAGHQGTSLDHGPGAGQSRYWNEPAVDNNGTGAPVVDPSQPPPNGAYQPPVPGNDPAAIQPPNLTPTNPPPANTPPTTQPPAPQPTPSPAPAPAPGPGGLPYGLKVPGKTGFVYSPYDKTAGIVDVQGMASGTKVKCPYTGKVFIVP